MVEVFQNKTQLPLWHQAVLAADHDERLKLLTEALDGRHGPVYTAQCDNPGCLFYKELLELNPNAKVILTVRDPLKWRESLCETVFSPTRHAYFMPWSPIFRAVNRVVMPFMARFSQFAMDMFSVMVPAEYRHVGFHNMPDDAVRRIWADWIDEVKRTVPAKQLLIFDVTKHGWRELCEFLELPDVPTEPFPHVNDRAEMLARMRFAIAFWYAPTVLLVLLLLFLMWKLLL